MDRPRGWTEEALYAARDMGHTLLMEGKESLARRIFAGLVAIDPADAYARLGLGASLHRLGRFEEAVREFEEALRVDPYSWRAAAWSAEVRLQNGDRDEAARLAGRARELAERAGVSREARARIRRIGEAAASEARATPEGAG
jgi:Flp pilus assembly protein TadD